MLPPLREIISMCESKEKQKRFFFSYETYTRDIVIDLIIVKLFGVCPVLFWIANICDDIIWDPTLSTFQCPPKNTK